MALQRLECVVQPYAWGDQTVIPDLLGVDPTGEPAAELWMGTHPRGPSRVSDDQTLGELIASDAVGMLGSKVAETFGELPFMFKMLAIAEPLSIQAHPSIAQAERGFLRENDEGLDLDAPNRTYRDSNHKPELIVALTPFEALCGFRAVANTLEIFNTLKLAQSAVPELAELDNRYRRADSNSTDSNSTDSNSADPNSADSNGADPSSADSNGAGIAPIIEWLLGMDKVAASSVNAGLRLAISGIADSGLSDLENKGLAAVARLCLARPDDPGVAVALLLNYLILAPGEGIFLAAGNVHGYLSGVGVEVMANSDNVVRGGLTQKHVDLKELMSIGSFAPSEPPIQEAPKDVHHYQSPVPEFALTRVLVGEYSSSNSGHDPLAADLDSDNPGPRLMLVTDGTIAVESTAVESTAVESTAVESTASKRVVLTAGSIVFVPDNERDLKISGSGCAFIAGINRQDPDKKSAGG